jgi:sulfate permease, SulP family
MTTGAKSTSDPQTARRRRRPRETHEADRPLSTAGAVTVGDPREWAAPRPSGLRRVLPILTWLPAYHRSSVRFDLIAGATLWGLLVPESIAYAGLAGLPPEAGLYTLLATLAAYVVFGTSRHLVVAATSASAVLLATAVASVGPVNADEYAANAAAVVLFCAGLLLLAGVLRLGFIAQFLSRPVMEGFVFGLAIFVTVKQLPKLFGIPKGEGNSVQQLIHLITHLNETSGATLAIGLVALALLVAVERYAPRIPGGLLVLVLGIAISAALGLAQHGVDIVGTVPSGLPSVGVPDINSEDIATLMAAAAGMVLVIFSESLGAAQAFATKYRYEIDPNQELVALGAANAGSGFIGGLAGGGSLSQSAVNEGAGARSEVSPLFAAVLILVTVLFLTPLFKNLPEAVLGALIIHAVARLWKFKEFRRYYRQQRVEFWLGIATLAGVTLIDVLPGLLIGVLAMLLLVIYNASRPHLGVLGAVPGAQGVYGDVERHPDYERVPGLLVLRLEAPLFYANATLVRDRIKHLVGASDPLPRAVVLELLANPALDITSAEMLEELTTTLRTAGIDVALADLRQPVVEAARRTGLLETLGEDRVFLTVADAVQTLGEERPSQMSFLDRRRSDG